MTDYLDLADRSWPVLRRLMAAFGVIRVPDKAHAAMAPFVLLLVELANGKRVLGHFHGALPPAIGSHVTAQDWKS